MLIDEELPPAKVFIADKGYASDKIRKNVEDNGGTPVIPPRSNRKHKIQIDDFIYALRNLVERCFNNSIMMNSTFKPIGTIYNGYWVEKTGSIKVKLTVDIKESGWYWRCLGFSFFGIPIPKWIFPNLMAYKIIENNLYRFYVGFSMPILGCLFSYSGLLKLDDLEEFEDQASVLQ